MNFIYTPEYESNGDTGLIPVKKQRKYSVTVSDNGYSMRSLSPDFNSGEGTLVKRTGSVYTYKKSNSFAGGKIVIDLSQMTMSDTEYGSGRPVIYQTVGRILRK